MISSTTPAAARPVTVSTGAPATQVPVKPLLDKQILIVGDRRADGLFASTVVMERGSGMAAIDAALVPGGNFTTPSGGRFAPYSNANNLAHLSGALDDAVAAANLVQRKPVGDDWQPTAGAIVISDPMDNRRAWQLESTPADAPMATAVQQLVAEIRTNGQPL